jgi:hydroxypyruvate reductase
VSAAIEAASAAHAIARVVDDESLAAPLRSSRTHVIAVGKAAAEMAAAWFEASVFPTASALVVSNHPAAFPAGVEFHLGSHPIPDRRSEAAAVRALSLARAVAPDETLVLLLSGGASALIAQPLPGVALDDKQQVVNAMLRGGADIHALNAVRKHISGIKGGRLAAACRGRVLTLAISDVVGDDLAVIGSGLAVPDPSTWHDAWEALNQHVSLDEQPRSIRRLIERGLAGEIAETLKPGDLVLARAEARVIAGRADAMAGARRAAERLGYRVAVLDAPITGEARLAAPRWLRAALDSAVRAGRCVISSGETTVRVTGSGRGGRNQEFALALVTPLAAAARPVAVASVGTDGVDGPTTAAGAIVDATTRWRSQQLGLVAENYLADNDSNAFFAALGDLIETGPTGTNVGDLQILLTGSEARITTSR